MYKNIYSVEYKNGVVYIVKGMYDVWSNRNE